MISVLPIFRGKPSGKIIILVKDRSLPMVTHQRNAAKQCTIKLPSYLISGTKFSLTLYRQPSFQATITGSVKLYIRAGEFSKKMYSPGLKAGFWSKKCPQKAGEPYAQFSPSEIWAIVTTLIKILVNTITQISEGENWA